MGIAPLPRTNALAPLAPAREGTAAREQRAPVDRATISDEARRLAAAAALAPGVTPCEESAARHLRVIHFLAIGPLGPFWLELPPDGRGYGKDRPRAATA